MDSFLLAYIFIIGLMVGSFLNVVIFRLATDDKIVNARSKCLACGHGLAWRDLLPVLSFMALRGKCRYCKGKISWQYPLIEAVAGILFAALFAALFSSGDFGLFNTIKFILGAYIFSALVVIFVFDIRHYIIPDEVVFPAIGVALLLSGLNIYLAANGWDTRVALDFLGGSLLMGGFFEFLVIITEGKGMGGGDVKLGFLLGLVLGISKSLLALFLSFISGAVVGILLIILGKKKMGSMLPFAPFLILGFFVSFFRGNEIIAWYFEKFLGM